MENEIELEAEESAELPVEEAEEQPEEVQEEEKPEPKPKLTLEQQRGILQRKLTKIDKELGLAKEKPADLKTKTEKSGDIDYGHLTFHNSKADVKITDDEDVEYLKQTMEETGKDQKTLLGSKWFQAEIKERQESRTVKEAVPSNTRRSTTSAKNTVDYWIAKGELPPADQVQLRRDVLNKRIEVEKGSGKFARTSFGT